MQCSPEVGLKDLVVIVMRIVSCKLKETVLFV